MLTRRQLALRTTAVAATPWPVVAAGGEGDRLPRRSDVSFSPRNGAHSAANWHDIAKAFHATRIDWTYGSQAFVAEARRLGFSCTAALSPLVGATGDKSDRLRAKNGELIRAPWQPWPHAYWGCYNNQAFRRQFKDAAMKLIAAGATGIQIDDAAGNYVAANWGACWCNSCMQKAQGLGIDLASKMESFQRDSAREFFEWLFQQLPAIITTSNNNAGMNLDVPTPLFDFSIGEIELRHLDIAFLVRRFMALDAAGRRQIVTLRSNNVAANRRAIALVYACGGLMIVPWDVYLRSTPSGSERFFGRIEDFADLYALIRRHAAWFDDFKLVSVASKHISIAPNLLSSEASSDLAVLRQHGDGRLTLHVVSAPGTSGGAVRIRTRLRSAALATADGLRPLASRFEAGSLHIEIPPSITWAVVLIN